MSQSPPPSSSQPNEPDQPDQFQQPEPFDLQAQHAAKQPAPAPDDTSPNEAALNESALNEPVPGEPAAGDDVSNVQPSAEPSTFDETTQVISNAPAAEAVDEPADQPVPVASEDLLLEAGSEQLTQPPDEPVNVVTHYPATPPPSKLKNRRRRRDPSPRFLVIGFCVWLLGAWFVALESTNDIRPIQWMVLCAFFCVMAFWPVLRLSQFREVNDQDHGQSADSFRSPGRLFIDWFCLNLIFQTIIWPLHLNAQWHTNQTWWLSATLASWSLITGAITALGCRSDKPIHRTLAAALCMLLLIGEPVVMVLLRMFFNITTAGAADGQITYHTTPLALVWELTSPAATWAHQPWQTQVPAAALAGVTGWLVIVATRRWAGQSSEPVPQPKRLDATVR